MPSAQPQQCTGAQWLQGEPCQRSAGTDSPSWSLENPQTGENLSNGASADAGVDNRNSQPRQQSLRVRPPLWILLAPENAEQVCKEGVKQSCWDQQSALLQAERFLWAQAAPLYVRLLKDDRRCSVTQWMAVPPAEHSKWLLHSPANSFGLYTDSWLNSNHWGNPIPHFPALWEVLCWAPPAPHGCTGATWGRSMRQRIDSD